MASSVAIGRLVENDVVLPAAVRARRTGRLTARQRAAMSAPLRVPGAVPMPACRAMHAVGGVRTSSILVVEVFAGEPPRWRVSLTAWEKTPAEPAHRARWETELRALGLRLLEGVGSFQYQCEVLGTQLVVRSVLRADESELLHVAMGWPTPGVRVVRPDHPTVASIHVEGSRRSRHARKGIQMA